MDEVMQFGIIFFFLCGVQGLAFFLWSLEFEPGLSAFTSEICFEAFCCSLLSSWLYYPFFLQLYLLPLHYYWMTFLLLFVSLSLYLPLMMMILDKADQFMNAACMLDMLESLSGCRIRQQELSITSIFLQHHHSSSDTQISTANWHGYDHTAI